MKVEFTNRAVRDLRDISEESRRRFGDRVATALEARIREVVAGIAHAPESAPQVQERPGMRVTPLLRYPFKVFYRVVGDAVRILHIRHAARRPWDFVDE
jgi:toxin ParE1/3/4